MRIGCAIIVAICLSVSNICLAAAKTSATQSPAVTTTHISVQQRLVTFIKKTITTLHYSAYKTGGTRFDLTHGVYVVDCSHYVDHVLHAVYPKAYSSLVRSTGAEAPDSENYYHFFTELPHKSIAYWNKVDSVNQLRPGDILVMRYQNHAQVSTGGHVMIVMKKPMQNTNAYLVRVADSARAGHSQDTRRHSGIGIGTLFLKADPVSGQPYAYAWKRGEYWKDNVSFAMGRPV
jgi:cell wall-associated NlpC family hydrolase